MLNTPLDTLYYDRKYIFIIASFFVIAAGVLPVCLTIFMGDLANVMTSSKDFDSEVSKICIKLIIYCVAYSIVMEIKDILGGSSGPWFQTDIRKNIYKKLMNLDISFFDANQTGTLLNNITSDVAVLNEVYIAKFLQVFNNIIQALCGLILSFVYLSLIHI